MNAVGDVRDNREVIVKINGENDGNKIWRESNYEFWKDDERGGRDNDQEQEFSFRQREEAAAVAGEDPSWNLIGRYLKNQRDAGGEMWLDTDWDMDDIYPDHTSKSPPLPESPVRNNSDSEDLRLSTSAPSSVADIESKLIKKRCDEKSEYDEEEREEIGIQQLQNRMRIPSFAVAVDNGGGEVLTCTSFQRRHSFLLTKTKSRLLDSPEPDQKSEKVAKSGPLRSGTQGNIPSSKLPDEEDDDPLFDEDIPEEFKKSKVDALVVLEWVSIILIVAALICSLSVPEWKERTLRGLHLWKWLVLILVLICGRLVSGWGIRIVVFFIERNFLLRKRVLYFVYGVRNAVRNCIWWGLVLVAWNFLFGKKKEANNKFLQFVNNVLVCFLVGSLLWLVKTLMVKVLASSFHVSKFFDRIQESLFNQYVIETLSGPPLIEISSVKGTMSEDSEVLRGKRLVGLSGTLTQDLSRSSSKKQPEGIPVDHLHKLNQHNISAWNMKRWMRIIRHGVLATLGEQILESADGDESLTLIRSEFEAKTAARKIFGNVARRGSKFIYWEDVLRFMREDEALKTMNLLVGTTESGKISKSALKNWVVNAFRERRALALTLNDTKTAVNKLHQMVNILVGIIIVIACVVILGIASSKYLLLMSSQVVVVAFIFGNTCKTVFEAIIFLFVMHPFDVGDRCEIDGVQMVVEEMNILTTVFLRFDNQRIIFPNSNLASRAIGNYYRSPDMSDAIDFCVHIATPAEKIAIIRQRIISYIESKKEHWYSSPTIVLMDLKELNKLKMSVWLRHRINHQDVREKYLRKGLVIEEMVKIFKEVDMEYRLLPQDVNICSMPPIHSARMPSSWTDFSK